MNTCSVRMDTGVCSIVVDDTYEGVGVEESNEQVHNHIDDEFEPEETYIIPNAASEHQHKDQHPNIGKHSIL